MSQCSFSSLLRSSNIIFHLHLIIQKFVTCHDGLQGRLQSAFNQLSMKMWVLLSSLRKEGNVYGMVPNDLCFRQGQFFLHTFLLTLPRIHVGENEFFLSKRMLYLYIRILLLQEANQFTLDQEEKEKSIINNSGILWNSKVGMKKVQEGQEFRTCWKYRQCLLSISCLCFFLHMILPSI